MSLMCMATAIYVSYFSQLYDIYSSYIHSCVATQIYINFIKMSIIIIKLVAMSMHGFIVAGHA